MSGSVGANIFWSKNKQQRRIHHTMYRGKEMVVTVDIPIIVYGIPMASGFDYIDAVDYWGVGWSLGSPNYGVQVLTTDTKIIE